VEIGRLALLDERMESKRSSVDGVADSATVASPRRQSTDMMSSSRRVRLTTLVMNY
jgi:hypothetical protein